MHDPIPVEAETIASQVIEAAFRVHRALGPGLLESVYEICLCHELESMDVAVKRQVNLPVQYNQIVIDAGLRLDVLAGNSVVVELKAVEKMLPLFEAQLLTYLKLSGQRLGLLINFNTKLLKDGIKRIVL